MKKITFILLALISGTAFAQESATAIAAADIVSPLSITVTQDLNFGKVSNNIEGDVIIATDGTFTGLSQIGNTTPTAAIFSVTAADGYRYNVTTPGSANLVSGANSITVDAFTDNAGAEPTGTGNAQTIGVGATLNVAANQPTGNYTGTFDVSVAYE
ncbi:DUF4402 domain-containing protein [Salegentibacter sp. JZCK2]|uniref:DUF4402 domain-containing protein n=1 Tax=Salegentibacter tibetensis TaxID=2873600 RepID=UPI001CCB1957|nr:DUF4402 domain-containing protein [Salegentibacter tibetensis]MBZ9729017.1 DUF4402 domain-containing protein [Salegentibacter tibetensis]